MLLSLAILPLAAGLLCDILSCIVELLFFCLFLIFGFCFSKWCLWRAKYTLNLSVNCYGPHSVFVLWLLALSPSFWKSAMYFCLHCAIKCQITSENWSHFSFLFYWYLCSVFFFSWLQHLSVIECFWQLAGRGLIKGRDHLMWVLLQFISGSIQKNALADFLPVMKLFDLLYPEKEVSLLFGYYSAWHLCT